MSSPKKYMAGSVPRFLRQSRLSYLPPQAVIGSRIIRGDKGVNLYFDIVMLPVPEFQRMRSNVGLQHVIAPGPKMGPTFNPGFVIADAKMVTVPPDEPDPEGFARSYFLMEFNLIGPEAPDTESSSDDSEHTFSKAVRECTVKNIDSKE